ncbi:putative ATP-binding protein [Escherichia coli]|nr:putative ATP-binding protein [Escherichia coli]
MTCETVTGAFRLLDAAFERATLYRTRLKRLKEIISRATATGTNALRAIYSGSHAAQRGG